MTATDQPQALLEAILDGGIRSVNFFNGRLLSGEDMTAEQEAGRAARHQIGRALGSGIAYGLEVTQVINTSPPDTSLVVRIAPGLAINRRGAALELIQSVSLALTPSAEQDVEQPAEEFGDCTLSSTTTYGAAPGVYLLVLAPVDAREGRAPASGFGVTTSSCDARYRVDGVQFRLIQIPKELIPTAAVDDPQKLRNLVAYECFGHALDWDIPASSKNDPFAAKPTFVRLLDKLRPKQLTDCDVPLAIVSLGDQKIEFVDMWSVRRRIARDTPSDEDQDSPPAPLFAPIYGRWELLVADRRRAEIEAMLFQFLDQLDAIRQETGDKFRDVLAKMYFTYLPPVGILPADKKKLTAWRDFLGNHAPATAAIVDAGLLLSIIDNACALEPLKVSETPLVALNVYRSGMMPDFVLFARTPGGMIRLELFWINDLLKSGNDAEIQIFGANGLRRMMVKGNPNLLTFCDLPAGDYHVQAIVDGKTLEATDINGNPEITVRGGQVTQVKFDPYIPPLVVIVTVAYNTMLSRTHIPGVDVAIIDALKHINIHSVWQLAHADPEQVARAVDRTPEYARALIADAAQALDDIREKRIYYDGMDDRVRQALNELGYTDDVALANADLPALGEQLGSQGFATRLVEQARQIVPREAWALDPVGLDERQTAALAERGVRSKGDLDRFLVSIEPARAAALLAVDESFVVGLRPTIAAQLTASSLEQVPTYDLTDLAGVNTTVADRLMAAGFTTVQALAAADTADVVRATGLAAVAATNLVIEATRRAPAGMSVVQLAPITRDQANKLELMGVKSAAELATKNAAEIVGAFGGDTGLAQAVIDGARRGLGRR